MQHFESENGSFPPGIIQAYEWPYFLHFLLPLMDQQAYYDALGGPAFQIPVPWASPGSWPLSINGQRLPMLLCPSDGMGDSLHGISGVGPIQLPKSNYLGMFSGLSESEGRNCTDMSQQAVFRCNDGTAIASITDGTSNTMAVAEYLRRGYPGCPWPFLDDSGRVSDVVRHPGAKFHQSGHRD